jgi:hypothetical protein
MSDYNWIIKDKKGKNKNGYTNPIYGKQFTLSNVKHPDTSINANTLFVIYDDGNHYNSRNQISPPNNLRFFGSQSYIPGGVNDLDHNIVSNHINGNIEFGYLTTIYEGDDSPPNSFSVSPGNNVVGKSAYPIDITQPTEMISASHSLVVPNTLFGKPYTEKDITLIINHNAILNAVSNGDFGTSVKYYFAFNELYVIQNPAAPNPGPYSYERISCNPNYFSLEPFAFNNMSAIYSKGLSKFHSGGVAEIDIQGGAQNPYTYINLRPDFNLIYGECRYMEPNQNRQLIINASPAGDFAGYAAGFKIFGMDSNNIVRGKEFVHYEWFKYAY